MAYRVVKDGVSQRVGDTGKFVEREKGDLIELSPEAAEHLIAEGFVVEEKPTLSVPALRNAKRSEKDEVPR